MGPADASHAPISYARDCGVGQFPVDVELDVENTEFSPGVRRMQAMVGQQAPFDHGRAQMQVLAGLEVTTKSVERTAEAIGADIAQREQTEIHKALQWELPAVSASHCEPIPVLYVQMDGTGVPVVKKETVGRQGKTEGLPAHTREAKLGCVFAQTTWDREGYAIRDPIPRPTAGPSRPRWSLAGASMRKPWKHGWSRAHKKVVIGDGAEWIWNLVRRALSDALQIVDLYHARQHLWEVARQLYPTTKSNRKPGSSPPNRDVCPGSGENRKTGGRAALDRHRQPRMTEKIRTEADFNGMPSACATPKFRRQHLFVGSGVIEAAMQDGGALCVSNDRECSGPSGEPTRSWHYAAAHLNRSRLKTTGRNVGRLNFHL